MAERHLMEWNRNDECWIFQLRWGGVRGWLVVACPNLPMHLLLFMFKAWVFSLRQVRATVSALAVSEGRINRCVTSYFLPNIQIQVHGTQNNKQSLFSPLTHKPRPIPISISTEGPEDRL